MIKTSLAIGVDPGAAGAIVTLYPNGDLHSVLRLNKATERDIYIYFKDIVAKNGWPSGLIEKVGGYIGTGQPGSAMFKFGQSYGALRMAMVCTEISFNEITPQAWQKFLWIPVKDKKGGESGTQFKKRLRGKAEQIFPREQMTNDLADAYLIAEVCRRQSMGET